MARRMKTSAQSTDRYKKGVAGAGPDYTKGVQDAGSWVEGSLASAARRDAGLQQAIANGTIDRGIQRTGDQGWKNKTLAKGPQNYTQSVATAGPAYQRAADVNMQDQQAAQAALANMDTSTRAGRIAKSAAWQNFVADQAAARKSGR